jgi:hypothetical protein
LFVVIEAKAVAIPADERLGDSVFSLFIASDLIDITLFVVDNSGEIVGFIQRRLGDRWNDVSWNDVNRLTMDLRAIGGHVVIAPWPVGLLRRALVEPHGCGALAHANGFVSERG